VERARPEGILITLAVTTVLTTIQRIVWVYQHAAGVPLDEAPTRSAPGRGAFPPSTTKEDGATL
jgi:hypothetical protein